MRYKNTKIRPILSAACLLIFLGMNLAPVAAANITVNSGMKNSDIQGLIDNAKAGDTLNFNGGTYHNVSLTINKKLNIVTTKNVVLKGNGSSVNETGKTTFVFYFTNQSSGSVLSGFNINTKSDYAIILSNVKNLNIDNNDLNGGYRGSIYVKSSSNINLTNNSITNSGGNGVTIDTSKAVNLYNNLISKNEKDGVHIQNSQKTNLTLNNILESELNGITIYSSNNSFVHNNSINNNNGEGISLIDTEKTNITGNNITYNRLNGILYNGLTSGTYVSYNYLIHDLNGLFLDSMSFNDTVRSNFIGYSYKSVETDYNFFYTGNGIKVGDNYQDTSSRIIIEHNTIYGNEHFSIEGDANFDRFQVGSNFYGTNDPWSCGVCPMINTKMDYAKVVSTPGGFQLVFYNSSDTNQHVNQIIDQVLKWTVSVLNSDGTTTQVLSVDGSIKNGTSFLNFTGDKKKTYVATAIINGVEYTFKLDADNSTSGTGNGTSPVQGNSTTIGTGNSTTGSGGNTTGNSTGGTTNNNGKGSGDSGSGTSKSNGTVTGDGKDLTNVGLEGASSNKGGQQSAGDLMGGSLKAVEVAVKNAINNTVNNAFNNLGIIALLGLIGIGYFKRDKIK